MTVLDHYASGMNRIVNVTVSKNNSVDYYTCNNKGYWLTNIIHRGENYLNKLPTTDEGGWVMKLFFVFYR